MTDKSSEKSESMLQQEFSIPAVARRYKRQCRIILVLAIALGCAALALAVVFTVQIG